ncbi:MAG TPA: alpha/beta fold hydrolase [Pseudonocardiaceae bacterium]
MTAQPPVADPELLVPLAPGAPGTPLFCVHASSGSAYSYLGLAGLLGDDRPVYGIEAPGFDGHREPVRSLRALSAEYAETLREFRAGGEVLLLGWSLGGVIAFDTASRLVSTGVRVPRLVLVDVSMPHVAELPPEHEVLRRFLRELLAAAGAGPQALDAVDPVIAALPSDATAEAALDAAERSGVLPSELDAELLTDRYAVFRAHLEASYGFEPTDRYPGPVTHFMASASSHHAMDWRPVAPCLTEHEVPGTHHSIWTGDSLHHLATLVRAALS